MMYNVQINEIINKKSAQMKETVFIKILFNF